MTVMTEEQTAFTLQELIDRFGKDSSAVKAAMDTVREWQTGDDHWFESTLEEWRNALESMGFGDPDISFGMFTQGCGASFTACGIDLHKLLLCMTGEIDESSDYCWAYKAINHKPWDGAYVWMWHVLESEELDCMISAAVRRTSHHYSHKGTCNTEWDVFSTVIDDKEIDALLISFMGEVEHLRQQLCDAIYRSLEEEYDYRTSDQNVLDAAEVNEYTFDEEGDYLP